MGSIFDESTLGTSTNQITFNDDSQSIYYRITDRYVLSRQVRQNDMPLPEEMGVSDFQTLLGASNYLIQGTMYPNDDSGYDLGKKALRKLASLAIEQDDSDSDAGYVPYDMADTDGYNKRINMKVLYVDLRESSKNGLKLPFRLFCKIKFPAIQTQDAISTTIGSSTATISGSSNLSFTLPHALGLTTYSSNGSINNVGDLPSYPSIVITGPVTTPRITNSTTGEYIELGITLATTGDSCIITYDQDSVSMTQAGNSVLNTLTTASTLFKLAVGTNNLTLTGATVGSGATASVSTFPLWPL